MVPAFRICGHQLHVELGLCSIRGCRRVDRRIPVDHGAHSRRTLARREEVGANARGSENRAGGLCADHTGSAVSPTDEGGAHEETEGTDNHELHKAIRHDVLLTAKRPVATSALGPHLRSRRQRHLVEEIGSRFHQIKAADYRLAALPKDLERAVPGNKKGANVGARKSGGRGAPSVGEFGLFQRLRVARVQGRRLGCHCADGRR